MLTTISISGVEVIVYRDDLNHEIISGNKLHKLTPNVEFAKSKLCSKILSFGGPYSNHLHALAWACKKSGLDSIGVVRGELQASLTPTLADCRQWGMQLVPISRIAYRGYQDKLSHLSEPCLASDINLDQNLTILKNKENTLVLPEGGSNLLAIESLSKAYQQVFKSIEHLAVTHAVCATGTGATVAGLRQAAPDNIEVMGMQAVAEHDATLTRIKEWTGTDIVKIKIIQSHLGKFGKTTPELTNFIDEFQAQYNIPLDSIYTGKAMYRLVDMIGKGCFKKDQRILFIHTGGLQGNRSH